MNNEFYATPAYNQLISEDARVLMMKTGREYDGMYGLGVPEDLAIFQTKEYFRCRDK